MRAFEPEPLATTIRGFGLDFYYHRVKLGQDLEIYFRNNLVPSEENRISYLLEIIVLLFLYIFLFSTESKNF